MQVMPGAANEREAHVLSCHGCGSHRLRRSYPRNTLERLGRGLTPLRFHRCSDCGKRGYHLAWAAEPSARPVVRAVPAPALSQDLREDVDARLRRRRILLSLLVAVVLGALASLLALPGR